MGLFNGFSFISPVEFCYWIMILVKVLLVRYGWKGKLFSASFLALVAAGIAGITLAFVLDERGIV